MADPLATDQDVADRFPRPFTAAETSVVTKLVGDASAIARYEVPDLDTRMSADPNLVEVVRSVVTEAVVRAIRNRQGLRDKQAGPFSASYQAIAEELTLTAADLARLRGPRRSRRPRFGNIRIRPGLL